MKKFVIALAITATALTVSGGPQRHLGAKLGLTAAQKQQIQQIRQSSREQNKELFASFQAKRDELRQLKRAGDPRAAQVKSELAAMRPGVESARKAVREQISSVLTPEQRAQLAEWRAKRRNRG